MADLRSFLYVSVKVTLVSREDSPSVSFYTYKATVDIAKGTGCPDIS